MEGRIWRVCDQPSHVVGPAYLVGLDSLQPSVLNAAAKTMNAIAQVPELYFSPDGVEDQNRFD
jgi:hypothetical protein